MQREGYEGDAVSSDSTRAILLSLDEPATRWKTWIVNGDRDRVLSSVERRAKTRALEMRRDHLGNRSITHQDLRCIVRRDDLIVDSADCFTRVVVNHDLIDFCCVLVTRAKHIAQANAPIIHLDHRGAVRLALPSERLAKTL